MEECDCDVVPLTLIGLGAQKICPLCNRPVTYLSSEEFEQLLLAIYFGEESNRA